MTILPSHDSSGRDSTLDEREKFHNEVRGMLARHPLGWALGPDRLSRLLGLQQLWDLYVGLQGNDNDFSTRFLQVLDVQYKIVSGTIADVPATGGLMVVANHPTGGAEGLVAQSLINQCRDDWYVLGNSLVGMVPELAERQFGVFAGAAPGKGLRAAARHLRNGKCLLVFPAGTVAHWQPRRGYAEAPWHPAIAGLAKLSQCRVLPLTFTATTTWRWKILSAVSRRARTALLLHELLAQRGKVLDVSIHPALEDRVAIETWFDARH